MFGKRLITPVRHARLPVVYPTRCNVSAVRCSLSRRSQVYSTTLWIALTCLYCLADVQTKRRAGRALDDENPLTFVRELFGSTGDDPGHWNFSPEWWGTQNNGWGRDSGEAVFCGNSVHGNGKVGGALLSPNASVHTLLDVPCTEHVAAEFSNGSCLCTGDRHCAQLLQPGGACGIGAAVAGAAVQ